MGKIILPNPQTRQWRVSHRGRLFGDIWHAKNIDLDSDPGKIKLATRAKIAMSDLNAPTMECPVGFIRTDADLTDRWWALTQREASSTTVGLMMKTTNTNPINGWGMDAIASTPAAATDDMEVFLRTATTDRLVVATGRSNLAELENGIWTPSWWVGTLGQTALDGVNPVIVKKFNKILLVGQNNFISTIDSSLNVAYKRLKFPDDLKVSWIRCTPDFAWIGLSHKTKGDAVVARWNGGEDTYETPISVNSDITYAGVILDGVPWTINGRGELLQYNGQAFVQMDALPVFYQPAPRTWDDDLAINRCVHPNGMNIVENKIHIVINSAISGTNTRLLPDMPSGLWVYSKDAGLYCKYTFGQFVDFASDWGASAMARNGAVVRVGDENTSMLVGVNSYKDNVPTVTKGIYYFDPTTSITNRGHFITSQIEPGDPREFWKEMSFKVGLFENAADKVIIKAKVQDDNSFKYWDFDNIRMGITWTSTTTFTSSDSNMSKAAVGDEIEVVYGKGAGATAHITAISLNAGTYTVTIDETLTGMASTAAVRVAKWLKLGTLSGQLIQRNSFKILRNSTWLQLKVELQGVITSPVIEQGSVEYDPLGT